MINTRFHFVVKSCPNNAQLSINILTLEISIRVNFKFGNTTTKLIAVITGFVRFI